MLGPTLMYKFSPKHHVLELRAAAPSFSKFNLEVYCISQQRWALFTWRALGNPLLSLGEAKGYCTQMLVQRERSMLACWYKTRLHSLRPMCKHIGLTSTMRSIKRRSLSIKLGEEAVAEKQPQFKWSNACCVQKNSKDSSEGCSHCR